MRQLKSTNDSGQDVNLQFNDRPNYKFTGRLPDILQGTAEEVKYLQGPCHSGSLSHFERGEIKLNIKTKGDVYLLYSNGGSNPSNSENVGKTQTNIDNSDMSNTKKLTEEPERILDIVGGGNSEVFHYNKIHQENLSLSDLK